MKKEDERDKAIQRRIQRTRPKYKVPNSFVYAILFAIIKVWARFLGIKANKQSIEEIEKVEGPVLAIGAHVNAVDFSGMILTLRKKKIAFVVAACLFYDKYTSRLFRMLGNIIPKKQFSVDFECIKAMKSFIDKGVSIGLYPEGRVSIDGRAGYVADSTVKLIKFLNVPVVFTYMPGGYLQRPRYANKMRKGPGLESTAKLLLTKEQVANYSNDKIRETIDNAFAFNEMEYQELNQLSFAPRNKKLSLTYGLDYLLHQCPKCKKECAMNSQGNTLVCEVCGNVVVVDTYGKISPFSEKDVAFNRIDRWYDFQRESLQEKIEKEENYTRKTSVSLFINDEEKSGFRLVERGELEITKDAFTFKSEDDNLLTFPIDQSPYVSVRLGEQIDFYTNYKIYRFVFDVKGEPAQYNLATEIFYKKFHE